jgi:hypothetical protein
MRGNRRILSNNSIRFRKGKTKIHLNDLERFNCLNHQCSQISLKKQLTIQIDIDQRDQVISVNFSIVFHFIQISQPAQSVLARRFVAFTLIIPKGTEMHNAKYFEVTIK